MFKEKFEIYTTPVSLTIPIFSLVWMSSMVRPWKEKN